MLAVPLLASSLDAFYLEHRLCEELEGGVEEGPEADLWVAWSRQRVWMEYPECGVRWERASMHRNIIAEKRDAGE